MPSEADIERSVCREARKGHGCIVYKISGPAQRGAPDRMVMFPNGVLIFIEFKAPGKTPTPLQLRVHDDIRRHGFLVFVIDSFKDGYDLIDRMANL